MSRTRLPRPVPYGPAHRPVVRRWRLACSCGLRSWWRCPDRRHPTPLGPLAAPAGAVAAPPRSPTAPPGALASLAGPLAGRPERELTPTLPLTQPPDEPEPDPGPTPYPTNPIGPFSLPAVRGPGPAGLPTRAGCAMRGTDRRTPNRRRPPAA
ncbi:hypothetical protein O7606_09410 [Micromonospora sp. WMMD882]|uniref:hypothetical protein n=1 Tax=Micromonospora sp. WMMD882 TaxID=3015151 RepID=UPI00248BC921|nr:hypothetical protein [Micromonospora sp. WMMD882]WBB81550.1 hypothetical protein O7606_09410 [Micromonospora sp. WMMD882]